MTNDPDEETEVEDPTELINPENLHNKNVRQMLLHASMGRDPPYPDLDEEETLTAEEADPFILEADDFDSVNQSALTEWRAQTTPKDRVKQTVRHLDDDASVKEISETALVPESETRSILDDL